jgi:hypothetical protein
MQRARKVKVGEVRIDTGQILVVDPWHMARRGPGRAIFEECCFRTLEKKGAGPILDGVAVVSETGYGDGTYPVYACFDGMGRVVRLTIDFMHPTTRSSS